jgi:hypothetical protein
MTELSADLQHFPLRSKIIKEKSVVRYLVPTNTICQRIHPHPYEKIGISQPRTGFLNISYGAQCNLCIQIIFQRANKLQRIEQR